MLNIEDIFQAVRLNDLKRLQSLIEEIDINVIDEDGQNLLHEAAAANSLECAKLLLQKNINTNYKDASGLTAMHYCAANNSFDVAAEILRYQPDLTVSDKYGNEALWTAVFNARGKYDLVTLLIKNNANPNHQNKNGKSPLNFAEQIKDVQLISILKNN